MQSKDQILAKITKDSVELKCSINESTIVTKNVDFITFIKACRKLKLPITSPILPLGTVRYSENTTYASLVVYYPQTKFDATVVDYGKVEGCLCPSIIAAFRFTVIKGGGYRLQKTRFFGVNEQPFTFNDNTKLFDLPFPNLDSDGSVCWGIDNIIGEFKNLTSVGLLISKFFSSPFNDHLYYDNKRTAWGRYIDMFKKLKELQTTFETEPESFTFPHEKISSNRNNQILLGQL